MICVRKYAKNQNQIKFETHGGYRRHLKGWNIQPETFRRLHSRLQIIINNIHFSPQMKHEHKDKKKHSLQLYLTTPTPQTHISNWHLSTNMFPASKSNLSVNIHSTQRTSSPPPPPHLDASRRSHSLSLSLYRAPKTWFRVCPPIYRLPPSICEANRPDSTSLGLVCASDPSTISTMQKHIIPLILSCRWVCVERTCIILHSTSINPGTHMAVLCVCLYI